MLSPPHAPNPMERVEETAHPRGKPGTPRNQTSNGLAMGHDQQSLLADSEITHSPPGPTHEILANPRFVISPRCLASLQDNLTNRRMRDPHVRWCERRAGKPGPPTRLCLVLLRVPVMCGVSLDQTGDKINGGWHGFHPYVSEIRYVI